MTHESSVTGEHSNEGWPTGTPRELIEELESRFGAEIEEYKTWLRAMLDHYATGPKASAFLTFPPQPGAPSLLLPHLLLPPKLIPCVNGRPTELLRVVRHVFTDGIPRDQETAMRDVAGYADTPHLSKSIRHRPMLREALELAHQWRIIERDNRNKWRLATTTIDDYEFDEQVNALDAVVIDDWNDENEVMANIAYQLGFSDIDSPMRAALALVITEAIQQGHIERQGFKVRKL